MTSMKNYYSGNKNNITGIQFGVFANRTVKNYSAVKKDPFGINIPESYDNFEPKKGGLVDLRLGTCDIYLNCATCGLNERDCPGHFGHTELAEPVFHYGFLKFTKNVLSCICLKCSNILLEKDNQLSKKLEKFKKSKSKFSEIRNLTDNVSFCFTCGSPVPKLALDIKKKSAHIKILADYEGMAMMMDEKSGVEVEKKQIIRENITPKMVYEIFKNISDEDWDLIGFDSKSYRPEDLIIKTMPIPPVIIRPTSRIDFLASATNEDGMTVKLADILKANLRIRKQFEKENESGEIGKYNMDNFNLLQYNIATYFNNENMALPRSEFGAGGKFYKSVSERIKGKTGRIRGGLMGKRVDFSARTVITSDPNINIDEVGVPLEIAMNLTVPEEVTPYNIETLTKLIRNGRDNYPGANFVFVNRDDNEYIVDLRYRKKAIKLNYGDVVERHLVNGDYVLFNRQPTLHRPSMMGHKVQVLNDPTVNTFRMNVSVNSPYGADFDGDEMNLHAPQSVQTSTELAYITNVKYQIINPRDSNPIIGCVQDTLAGAYLLTTLNQTFTGHQALRLLGVCNNVRLDEIDKKKNYDGKEIFSKIIPKEINLKQENNGKIVFEIVNGELKVGILNKTWLSKSKNSLIHIISNNLGGTKAQEFMDNCQRFCLKYLEENGITIGFDDILLDKKIKENLNDLIINMVTKVEHNLTEMENDNLITPDLVEQTLAGELNSAGSNINKYITDNLTNQNSLIILQDSGAKGSQLNTGQMTGLVGQQVIDGSRIEKSVNNRTLFMFHQNDDTPKARGFITSSYLEGLKSHELFFESKAGREGLIDTALKTAKTGYMQRKIIKGLEDYKIEYDGTIRNAMGMIIEYNYGDSGIDTIKQVEVYFPSMELSNKEIEDKYLLNDKEIKEQSKLHKIKESDIKKLNDKVKNVLINSRDMMRMGVRKLMDNYKTIEDRYMLPFNLYQIIQLNKTSNDFNNNINNNIHPNELILRIEEFLEEMLIIPMNNNQKKNKSLRLEVNNYSMGLIKYMLYEFLNPKKAIYLFKLSKKELDKIFNYIQKELIRSIVEPGEMVGVIAGQSLGEPLTQMTLDTKHATGSATTGDAMAGVPRIQEILNFTKSIKTPMMTVYLQKEFVDNKKEANIIASYMKYLNVGHLIDEAQIYYHPFDNNNLLSIIINNDKTDNPFFIDNQETDINTLPWIYRFVINRETLMDKEMSLMDVKIKFLQYWKNNYENTKEFKGDIKETLLSINKLAILSNYESDEKLIIHIRVGFKKINMDIKLLTKTLMNLILEVKLKGMNNVSEVLTNHERYLLFDNDGSMKVNKEYIIKTSGINLEELRLYRKVDQYRSNINDIRAVYMYYGIEAARSALFQELTKAYRGGGKSINYQHLNLCVNMMTQMGFITAIDRHGLDKLDIDPLARASFEEMMDKLTDAAIYNQPDNMNSVSSRIMVGRAMNGGTNAFEILIDVDKIAESEMIEPEKSIETFNKLTENVFINDLFN